MHTHTITILTVNILAARIRSLGLQVLNGIIKYLHKCWQLAPTLQLSQRAVMPGEQKNRCNT